MRLCFQKDEYSDEEIEECMAVYILLAKFDWTVDIDMNVFYISTSLEEIEETMEDCKRKYKVAQWIIKTYYMTFDACQAMFQEALKQKETGMNPGYDARKRSEEDGEEA